MAHDNNSKSIDFALYFSNISSNLSYFFLMSDILFSNEDHLNNVIKHMIADGKEHFHVVADFDRTLTKAFVNWEKSSTVIAQIRNGEYLTPDYASKAHKLFDHYNPIEIDPNYPKNEKIEKMYERWEKHFNLIVQSWLTKEIIDEIVATRSLRFREWSPLFFDILKQNNIPLVIISASIGDMINTYLLQEWFLSPNIHVVSNFFEYDDNGKTIGVKKTIVHSMNKSEVILDQFDFFDDIKERKNILLLWDSLDDIYMADGFVYDNIIKVGFLNADTPEQRVAFLKVYDVVIVGDGDMGWVNTLIQKLLSI